MADQTLFYGEASATCPYCRAALAKFPGRSLNCKVCNQYINRVRRPWDKRHVLIRNDQLLAHEEQMAISWGTHSDWLARQRDIQRESKRIEAHQRALTSQLGRVPSDCELEISILSEDLQSLWRDRKVDIDEVVLTMRSIANALYDSGQHWAYLDCVFEYTYLQAQGYDHMAAAFDMPTFAYTRPNPGREAARIASTLINLSVHPGIASLRFIERSAPYRRLGMPFDPRRVWHDLAVFIHNAAAILNRPARRR